MPLTEEDSYSLRYHCNNCGHAWRHKFVKGERAGEVMCPNCECFTGKKAAQDIEPPVVFKEEDNRFLCKHGERCGQLHAHNEHVHEGAFIGTTSHRA